MHPHKTKNIHNSRPVSPETGLESRHGFTLVELIVTITIIAILGVIAFTAFKGFESSARDSTRSSDLANLSQGLDTSYIKTGSYPNPDNAFTVTYSGGSLWYQGTVGDTVINILSSNGSKMSKKPTDPLTTTKEYTYSKSAYGNIYELTSNWEGDSLAFNLPHLTSSKIGEEFAYLFSLPLFKGESEGVTRALIPQAFASSGNPLITYIKGNYNGMVAKTVTGSVIYVIATPSITTSTGTAGANIDVTTLSGKLLYHGQTNSGGIAYTPTLVYSGATLPINDDTGKITLFTTNLKTAYSGSVVSYNSNIANILSTTGATNITSLGASIITNYLGGSASAPPPPPVTSYSLSNSLMFDSASSQYLSRTPSVGNKKTFTYSTWLKRGKIGAGQLSVLFSASTSATNYSRLGIYDDYLWFINYAGANQTSLQANTILFRDPSAWYHIVLKVDTTQSTDTNRVKLWVNGIQITNFTSPVYPAQNYDMLINSSIAHKIGVADDYPTYYADGYLADVNFVDSGALDPTAFGYADSTTNQWLPKQYTGTYGTNGFHLDFSSGSNLGKDANGTNDWTVNGGMNATNNQVIDTPLNNFATLNPLDKSGSLVISKGNLTVSNGATYSALRGTMEIPTTGKWYFEYTENSVRGANVVGTVGLGTKDAPLAGNGASTTGGPTIYWGSSGKIIWVNGVNTAGAGTWVTPSIGSGDTIQIAYDADTKKVWFGVNNTWYYGNGTTLLTGGNPSSGTNESGVVSATEQLFPYVNSYSTNSNTNFGQRPFTYTPPSGFKALSTANLPTPATVNPKQYFDVLTYAGNNGANTLNTLGFQPDFVWIKARNGAFNNTLQSSVTGWASLISNQTLGESTVAVSPQSNGFNLNTSNTDWNATGTNYVAWNWKKGSGINSSGFDIQTWNHTNGSPDVITHNLGKTPDMIIWHDRNASGNNWWVQHKDLTGGISGGKNLYLNTTSSGVTNAIFSSINSSAFSFYQGAQTASEIAYLWSEVPGFSKFGSYTANGSATDGPFIYTGFRPRYVMIKAVGGNQEWVIVDSMRDTYNPTHNYLLPNSAAIEGVAGNNIDFLSNGFKIRTAGDGVNYAPVNPYIYAAFAEAPFKYANAR